MSAGTDKIHDPLGFRKLFRLAAIGLHLRGDNPEIDLSGLDRTAHIPQADDRTGYHAPHVDMRPLALLAGNDAGGIGADVVRVALRTIDQHALDSIKGPLNRLTDNTWPISGDLATANRIRMALKVHDCDRILAWTVDTHELNLFIRFAHRRNDIGITNTGICLACTVLHPVAADEGYALCLATGIRQLGGREIGKRKLHCRGKSSCERLLVDAGAVEVVEPLPIRTGSHHRSGVSVGACNEHSLRIKTCLSGHAFAV